jgi:hypothetical protein
VCSAAQRQSTVAPPRTEDVLPDVGKMSYKAAHRKIAEFLPERSIADI